MKHPYKLCNILFLFFIFPIYATTLSNIGDMIHLGLPGLSTLSALHQKEFRKPLIKSMVSNITVTYSLKHLAAKQRPNKENNLSFPSAHSSNSFQAATALHYIYGKKVGIPAFILASFVAYSRIEAKKHDLQDVAAGAFIGSLCSHIMFKKPQSKYQFSYRNKQIGIHVKI